MNPWVFSFSPYLGLFFTFMVLVLVHLPMSLCNAAGLEKYNTCSEEFNCGNITGLTYPFWGSNRPWGCGHPELQLYCHDHLPTIKIKGVEYRVLSFNQDSQTLRIARQDYFKGICSPFLINTTLDPTLFDYAGVLQYITFLYGCPSDLELPELSKDFSCSIAGIFLKKSYFVFGTEPQGPGLCNASVSVPILPISVWEIPKLLKLDDQFIEGVMGEGFEVKLKIELTACNECQKSSGACGYGLNRTTCFCKNQPESSKTCSSPTAAGPSHPPSPPGLSKFVIMKVVTGTLACVVGITVVFAMTYGYRRKSSPGTMISFLRKKSKEDHKMEEFMKSNGSLAPRRYSFSDVKKMTNSFADKLGQGGFGCVYKGKLSDGRLVAVKVLSEFKATRAEFMNEVASISRTSHVNIVMLIGFCYDGVKRALIYEFMPNGSLDKFISDTGSSETSLKLEWKTMYQIAVGISRGLQYLHKGCHTRILHFDIKPHNILLDENFCPKISDFGLAKLCQSKESIISITGARGTVGYIAPEVFCRNFGGVSHKSDVYSYGMLVLEIVGGIKNKEAARSSDVYFPEWIYKHLEQGEDLMLGRTMTREEEETLRKMILVSLWCIQTNPLDRPSISKVVEMLEGSLHSLQTPPRPFLFCPA